MKKYLIGFAILGACTLSAGAATLYSTGFEPGEGYVPGYAPGQKGWTTFTLASKVQPVISTVSPASGTQALTLGFDPDPMSILVAAKSPSLGPQAAGRYIVSVDVMITGVGGADYAVTPQFGGTAAARVDFDYMGHLWVRDAAGVSHDTGVEYRLNAYKTLTIDLNAATHSVKYFYDNTLIYTGSTWVVGGVERNSIDQVILSHDQYNIGDVGRFDNLSISTPEPAGLLCLGVLALLRRRG